MNGIIVLNKEAGYTSMDCCAILRKICAEKRIGHTGTLDPNATGVLPVCVGKAARLIEYMDGVPKTYRCTARLGIVTDTQDIWGNELEGGSAGKAAEVTEEAVEEVLAGFLGTSEQLPPMYSAVKIGGRKLYEYARSGRAVERKPRSITISSISLVSFDRERSEFTFDVECSRGTYVRTLCSDAGERLGCGACMSALVRTGAAGFSLADAVTLDEIRERGPLACLLPPRTAVKGLLRTDIGDEEAELFLNGDPRWNRDIPPQDGFLTAVFCKDRFLGTARDGRIEKVFKDEDI